MKLPRQITLYRTAKNSEKTARPCLLYSLPVQQITEEALLWQNKRYTQGQNHHYHHPSYTFVSGKVRRTKKNAKRFTPIRRYMKLLTPSSRSNKGTIWYTTNAHVQKKPVLNPMMGPEAMKTKCQQSYLSSLHYCYTSDIDWKHFTVDHPWKCPTQVPSTSHSMKHFYSYLSYRNEEEYPNP